MSYPNFEELIGQENKEALLEVKPSLRANFHLIVYFILSVIGIIALNILFVQYGFNRYTIFKFISLRWLAIIPFVILIEIVRRYFNNLYVFSLNKLSRLQGRLSLKYSVPSIKYGDIRGIVVEQSFSGRVLNFGNILLGTAAQDENEISIDCVKDPYQLASIIEQFRSYNLSQDGDTNPD